MKFQKYLIEFRIYRGKRFFISNKQIVIENYTLPPISGWQHILTFDIIRGKFDIFKHNCIQNVLKYEQNFYCLSKPLTAWIEMTSGYH